MARHLDLGDDRDLTLGGIGHDVADLVLRVVAAVGRAVVFARVGVEVSDVGFGALRTDARQLGIFLDLDAPALILGQMPVEGIDLMGADDVDIGLHLVGGEEVAAAVEVGAAVGEARSVLDAQGRNAHLRGVLGRGDEQLFEGLQAPPYALHRAACEQDLLLVGGAVERVSLFGQRGVDAQLHGGLAQRFGRAQAGESVSFEAADEQVGQTEQFRVVAADDDTLRQIDRASGLPDVYRFGNDARLGMDTFLQEDACQEQ